MKFHARAAKRVLATIGLATCASVAIAAWQVRDANMPAGPSAGSGVLRGVVVTDTADPQPVRRATVHLSGTGTVPRLVGTNDLGQFLFNALPAGRYTLSATKVGFVRAFHGSTQAGVGPGVPVAVSDDQAVDVSIRLLPGAVITGVVTDARGLAAAGVSVAATDTRPRPGAAPAPARAVTDDRGIYRLFGLAPGDYLVSALPQLSPAPGGRVGQSPGAVAVVTDADVQWARSAVASMNTGFGSTGGPSSPGAPVAYAPVFYPGTTDVAGALSVRVTSGVERGGVDLPLRIVRLARLAGSLADDQGRPLTSATVVLVPKRGDQPSPVDTLVASGALSLPRATVSASTFAFTGVAPGQYTLVARTGSGQRGVAAAEAAAQTLWSVTDLMVDGVDRENLELRLLPGVAVTGRVVFEDGAAAPVDPATLNLSLVATNPIPGVAATYRAAVQTGGTFRVPSIPPGNYMVRSDSAAGGRWLLKSAVVNGRDLADLPLVAANDGSEVAGVTVTFTNRLGEITGRLIDGGGQPVTRYSIIVFTADQSLWLPNARRVRATRPATDGSFAVDGLPAGAYGIVAVEDAENVPVYDAAFLAGLLPSAVSVTLDQGESRRQDFRLASEAGVTGR
jgi:hypothetical protein